MMYSYFDAEPFRGEDLMRFARIRRDADAKSLVLQIDRPMRWRLFYGVSPASVDGKIPCMEGVREGAFRLEVPPVPRPYFGLVTETGTALLAETRLPVTGARNLRDMGGIRTTDGRYTRWGRLYRSDDLSGLTPEDLAYISSLSLVSVVDFRSRSEASRRPDRLPRGVAHTYAFPMTPGDLEQAAKDLSAIDETRIDEWMERMYVKLVSDRAYVDTYRSFFALLQQPQDLPLLFHCSAGKDRTGLAAALVLYALQVDEETILSDYLASNGYVEEKYAGYIARMPALKPLFEVKPRYLCAAVRQIRRDYRSVDAYLEQALAVDLPRFRQAYLY